MFSRSGKRYVVLQEYVPLKQQRAIARAVVTVWPRIRPSRAFVDQLSRDLATEAHRQVIAHHSKGDRTLNFLGLFSGGVLSVVGGLAIWLLVQRDQDKAGNAPLNPSQPASRATAA